MSNPVNGQPAAGWYPDPAGSAQQRWWDGSSWAAEAGQVPVGSAAPAASTPPRPEYGEVAAPAASTPPAAAYGGYGTAPTPPAAPPVYGQGSYGGAQTPPKVAEGTPVFTPFIWAIAALPVLSIIALAFWDVSNYMQQSIAGIAAFDPGYLLVTALGWVIYGVSVALAFFDHKTLVARGFAAPFHWAWTFLSPGVYIIGRSIIVRRRSGRGLEPIWVWLGVGVIGAIVAVTKFAQMFVAISDTINGY